MNATGFLQVRAIPRTRADIAGRQRGHLRSSAFSKLAGLCCSAVFPGVGSTSVWAAPAQAAVSLVSYIRGDAHDLVTAFDLCFLAAVQGLDAGTVAMAADSCAACGESTGICPDPLPAVLQELITRCICKGL